MSDLFKKYMFYISAVLLVLSAALYITEWKFVPYVYAVASAGVAVVYLTSPYKGNNLRLKRLNIQEAIAAVLLPVSSYYMFKGANEWFLFLAVSAILQFYAAFVKSKTQQEDGENHQSAKSKSKKRK